MIKNTVHTPPLNDVQVMLLKLFSRPMDAEDLASIRNMLLSYYDILLQKELDTVISEKKIRRENFETVLQQSQRTQ